MAAPERNNRTRVLFFIPWNTFFLDKARNNAMTMTANIALYRAISLLESEISLVKTPMVPNMAMDIENEILAGNFPFIGPFSSFF